MVYGYDLFSLSAGKQMKPVLDLVNPQHKYVTLVVYVNFIHYTL